MTMNSHIFILTDDPETDALLFGTAWGTGVDATATTALSYSFASAGSLWTDYGSYSEPTTGFVPLASSIEQDAVGRALQSWASIANLTFQEVADTASGYGTLRIGYTTLGMDGTQLGYAYAPTIAAQGGDVWLNAQFQPTLYSSFTPGTLSSYVLIHELGHALGLKHPHAESPLNTATLGELQDSLFNSVMSYYAWPGVALTQNNIDRLPSTPMALDIDALQAIYGANASYHSGDDTYLYGGNGKYLETIYDAAGNDTIKVTGGRDTEIDLRPDEWSRIGTPVLINGGSIQSADTVRIYGSTLIENAIGGDGDDTLIGNDGDNQLIGGAGNDILSGSAGSDTLQGGQGADVFVLDVDGGDMIADFSATQGDKLDVGRLIASLIGYTPGANPFAAGFLTLSQIGTDTLLSGDRDSAGSQYFTQPLAMLLNTSATNLSAGSMVQGYLFNIMSSYITITGTPGDDVFNGTVEDERFEGGGGNDTVHGGGGIDDVVYSGLIGEYVITQDLTTGAFSVRDTVANRDGTDFVDADVEEFRFFDAHLTVAELVAYLNGAPISGDDTLVGDDDDNILSGGLGNDDLTGNGGDDLCDGGDGDDIVRGGDGDDDLRGGDGNDDLHGDAGVDVLSGGTGDDSLDGGSGNDDLTGGDGIDRLDGGIGADHMVGGLGADTYIVDDSGDLVVEADNVLSSRLPTGLPLGLDLGSAIDTVTASIGYTLANYVENLQLAAGTSNLSGVGNSLDNVLIGNDGDNTLTGGAGNDTLDGGLGTDTAIFVGNRASYTVTATAAGYTISSSAEGTDALVRMERAQFADQTISLATTVDTTAPTVTLFDPSDEATGVAVFTNVNVTFSELIQRGAGTIVLKTASGAVVETFDAATSPNLSISGGGLTINPSADLSYGTAYKVEFSAGTIKDPGNNSFAGTSIYNFTTAVAPNLLLGTTGSDILTGGVGDDSFSGLAGNDTFNGQAGNDTLDGGTGTDTAIFNGNRANYAVTKTGSTYTVQASIGIEGIDTLTNIERLKFADQTVAFDISGNPVPVPASLPVVPALTTSTTQTILPAPAANAIVSGSGLDVVDLSNQPSTSYQLISNGDGSFSIVTAGSNNFVAGVMQVQFSDKTITLSPTNAPIEYTALLYQGALGRTPEPGGLAGWSRIATGLSPETQTMGVYGLSDASGNYNGNLSIAAGFTNSPEFIDKYGGLSNELFVTRLYNNVLDRDPAAKEVADWIALMTTGPTPLATREHVLVGFALSQEAIDKATVGYVGIHGQHDAWLMLS